MDTDPESYGCRICGLGNLGDKTALVEHLRTSHEVLEIASYAAATMMNEEDRDRIALGYFRQLEQIKKEIASG